MDVVTEDMRLPSVLEVSIELIARPSAHLLMGPVAWTAVV